ncbi:ABC transporter substrate-binding protein [Streptacidiphilus jiangxiensis]|uniref:Peptide/nickel transport system substrate-binding protein n=1 Tax=Streptacidiphilus jiangxiensis TaxID=235985 RepID=A0A1H7HEY5_STRJI|nr:ABC transporter substrate-binding protein [Streptacidiphilus jiangxiensis]SEK48748.1 peptide/nickel transport system substrate-binding protein [Streptacidiphilus jiangxiensis]
MPAPRRSAALVLATAVALTAAACTSSSTSSGSAATNPAALTAFTPTARGQLAQVTWNLPTGEPLSLDPAKAGDYSPSTVLSNLCEPLLRLKADYTYGPGLAASWKWTTPTTLVLDLRDDVRFWDGTAMTSADVVASLTRQLDPATRSVNVDALRYVSAITAGGPHQVTVAFKKPDQLFVKTLTNGFGQVSEAAYLKAAGAGYGTAKGGLMCTGPFKLASWQAGESITLTRNTAYWDRTLQPKVENLTFRFITDGSTLTSALLSGQIDGSYEINTATARALAHSSVGHLYQGDSAQTVFLTPTAPTSPLADVHLVQALQLVLDRDAVIRNVYDGAAQELKTFIPSLVWQHGPAASTYAQGYAALPAAPGVDVTKAKALVAQATTKSRSITVAMAAGDQQSLQTLTFLQAGARQIGLDVTIKQLQPTQMSGLFYDPSLRQGLDATIVQGYVEMPDPGSYVEQMTDPGSLFNWVQYRNASVSALLARARSDADPARSAAEYNQAQALFTKDLPILPIAAPDERLFLNDRLSGAPASFAYINMPWAAYLGGTGKGNG